jgi:hypothetical protein
LIAMSSRATRRARGALAAAAAVALSVCLPPPAPAQPGPRDERALPRAMPSSPPGFRPVAPAASPRPAARPVPAVPPEAEQVYRWTDADGHVHLTQGLANVPEAHRGGAVPLGSVSGRGGGAPAPAPDPVARQAVDAAAREARSVFDHLIVAEAGYTSLRERGVLGGLW